MVFRIGRNIIIRHGCLDQESLHAVKNALRYLDRSGRMAFLLDGDITRLEGAANSAAADYLEMA